MVFQDFLWDSAKVMFLDEPEVAHHITYCLLGLFLSFNQMHCLKGEHAHKF